MNSLSYPRRNRLACGRQIRDVLACGMCSKKGVLTLYAARRDRGYPRLCISVNRAVGSAVVRNRLKRLFREVFRQDRADIPLEFDYLLVISPKGYVGHKPLSFGGAELPKDLREARSRFLDLVAAVVAKGR